MFDRKRYRRRSTVCSRSAAKAKTDQFVIRASNGVSMSVNAGNAKPISVGERYRDNAIVAWATIQGDAVMGTASFGVASAAHTPGSGHLIPIAVAEIGNPRVGAANVRIVSIDQIAVDQMMDGATRGRDSVDTGQH